MVIAAEKCEIIESSFCKERLERHVTLYKYFSANDGIMRAMVYEGGIWVSAKRVGDQCDGVSDVRLGSPFLKILQ